MTETAVTLTHVTKKIQNKNIIKDLSFSIPKGEVFGFIGPNGAGKTTTIRMIVGLISITKGDIEICGKSIKKDFQAAVRHVGAIVENPEMYPFMTGWQNLKHFANMVEGVTEERIHEVIQLVGLEKVVQQKVGRYSLGMRQRLGIAQALLHHPDVLILDEPTNGLDPAGIKEIRQYIRRLATEENISVIVSSHLLSEIELMCDRIGVIKNGELVALEAVHDDAEATEAKNQELRNVTIEVTPIEKAQQLLTDTYSFEVSSHKHQLSFQCQKEEIPQVISTLVQHDIKIYSVERQVATLEDKFFDLIGENTID